MWAPMIVLVLPASHLGGELGDGAEGRTMIEFLAIGPMAALDFSVALRAPRRNVAIGDAEIAQVPGEIGPELVPVIGLDALNGDGQPTADLVNKRDGVRDGALRIDLENAVPTRLVNRGELIEADGGEQRASRRRTGRRDPWVSSASRRRARCSA